MRGNLPIVRRSSGNSQLNGSNFVGTIEPVAIYAQPIVYSQPVYNKPIINNKPVNNQLPSYNRQIAFNQPIVQNPQPIVNGTSVSFHTPVQQLNQNQNIIYFKNGENKPTDPSKITSNINPTVNHAILIKDAPISSTTTQFQPQPQSQIQPSFN